MRLLVAGVLTAIGLALAATSGAFAAPIAPLGTIAGATDPLSSVHYYGYYHHRHHHCWWRYGRRHCRGWY